MQLLISGIVVEGDHRGRELGYPTANVLLAKGTALPDDGVYAGTATRENAVSYRAAISVGHRPTFYDDDHAPRLLEAFLLDFDGDLYGEVLRVEIRELLRAQRHFDSRAELIDQIAADVELVRERISVKVVEERR